MKTPLYKIYYKYKEDIKMIQIKDESKNIISNSIKDRPAKFIIDEAYQNNLINKDSIICEVTSGNMGIALANVCKLYGNKIIICMPKFVSKERIDILNKLNVELILTDSFEEAFQKANEISVNKNIYLTKQFENINNADSYNKLIEELQLQTAFYPAFICGVGTGGTINGIGTRLKNNYHTKIFAIEPLQTKLLSTGISHGPHKIEGLSDGFIPSLYPKEIIDDIYSIDENDAICIARKLNKELNLPVGISSGANVAGAILTGIDGIITVFPDNNSKYLSTDLFNEEIESDFAEEVEFLYYDIIE